MANARVARARSQYAIAARNTQRVAIAHAHAITLTVNGIRRRLRVRRNDLLLNVLREELELTGTKYGCGIGECSACTVLMDGQPVLACLVLAVGRGRQHIRTIEGLAAPDGDAGPAAGGVHRLRGATSAATARPAC